jgi:energy-coupling factor transport system permease protein
MPVRRTLKTIHPLAKLAWVLNTSVVAGVMSTPRQLFWLAMTIVVVFALLSGLSLRNIGKYWRILLTIPVLLFAFHLFLYPAAGGSTQHLLFRWRFLHVTTAGLADAALYSLRLFCSVFALVLFLATTEIKAIIVSLIRVRVPVPFAYAIYLMLRAIPVMGTEAKAIAQALKTRLPGRVPLGAAWLIWWRYVFALVLIGVRRAEQTALAMDARGFALGRQRTFLRESRWNAAGVFFLVGNLLISWGLILPM